MGGGKRDDRIESNGVSHWNGNMAKGSMHIDNYMEKPLFERIAVMPGENDYRSGETVIVTIGESRSDAVIVDPPNVGGWGRVRIPTGHVIVANRAMLAHKEAHGEAPKSS